MARTRPDAYQIEPGTEGQILRVVGGVVTWIAASGIAGEIMTAASGLTEAKVIDGVSFSGNGTASAFVLASAATKPGAIRVYLDGLRLLIGAGNDYTVLGDNKTIVMEYVPAADQNVLIDYRVV